MPAVVIDAVAQVDPERASSTTHVVHIAHLTVKQLDGEEVAISSRAAVQYHSIRMPRPQLRHKQIAAPMLYY